MIFFTFIFLNSLFVLVWVSAKYIGTQFFFSLVLLSKVDVK